MFSNYVKIALRSLVKHKEYSIINILGLAIGLACVILILLFVREEMSVDRFHANKDRIYRLSLAATYPHSGERQQRAIGPFRLAREMKPEFPDLDIIRFGPQNRVLVAYGEQRFYEEQLCFVDPDVFEVFSFRLLHGDPATVLDDPFSVVISEEVAQKYFGQENAIGKRLSFYDNDFLVTGVMADMPRNTQFQYNMFASMNCADQVFSRIVLENWGEGFVETFIMLPPGATAAEYKQRFAAFVDVKLENLRRFSPEIIMQPLERMYLYSRDLGSFMPAGDITYVYAFTAIAIFILIIACINFMNLATARSAGRAKEVGLRKVVGAQRRQLVWQFLSESVVLATLALFIALALVGAVLPFFNELAGKALTIDVLQDGPVLPALLAITFAVGVVAGSYPALFLSAFEPVKVLSGVFKKGIKGGGLRKALVTFQFAISIFLIAVTVVVYKQLEYARNVKLGYEREHLVVIPETPVAMRQHYDRFRAGLMAHPGVVNASASSRVPPGQLRSSFRVRPEGIPEEDRMSMQMVWVDFDFIETMGFELAAGRSFSREYATDATSAFVINEAAAQRIGWSNEEAVGKSFGSSEIKDWDSGQWEPREGRIIGVLKDFHFESLHQEIEPTVYFVSPYMAWNYVVRIRPENISETLAFIEDKWQAMNPTRPFEYNFVDETFDNLYRTEARQGAIFAVFAMLADLRRLSWPGGTGIFYSRAAHKRSWHSQSIGGLDQQHHHVDLERIYHPGCDCLCTCCAGGLVRHGTVAAGLRLSYLAGHRYLSIGWCRGLRYLLANGKLPGSKSGVDESCEYVAV